MHTAGSQPPRIDWTWLAVGPAALLLLLFLVVPAVLGLLSTVTNYGPTGGNWQIVGLENYRSALSDLGLRVAFGNGLLLALLTVPAEAGLGLILALALRR